MIYFCGFILIFLKFVSPLLTVLFNYTLGKRLYSKRKYLKRAGDWAVITGASDGIGKAYAKALAGDSLNVMLISRNHEKLEKLAEEIRAEYGVEVRIVVADFTKADVYPSIEIEVNKLPSIGCLVNNVGLSYPYVSAFANTDFLDYDFIRNIITCNTVSTTAMTRMILPRMCAQNTTGAAIINLSSASGLTYAPYLALYGATKAFIDIFSGSVSLEVTDSKVIFQSVHPYFVSTAMTRMKPSIFTPSPDTFAEHALDMLGVEEHTYGYCFHAIFGHVVKLLPIFVISKYYKRWADSFQRKLKAKSSLANANSLKKQD